MWDMENDGGLCVCIEGSLARPHTTATIEYTYLLSQRVNKNFMKPRMKKKGRRRKDASVTLG